MAAKQSPYPIDRNRCEHVGLLDKIVWSDAEQPVSILALTDGKRVVIDAPPETFARKQSYRFLGRWEEGTRGPQFRASDVVIDTPASKEALTRYLADICEGIGPAIAGQLWDAYGTHCVKELRANPMRCVLEIGGLTAQIATDAARDLGKYARHEKTRIELFGLLKGKGFPGKVAKHALAKWGVRAPDVIRANAFRLMLRRIPGCGWKRCDRLYLDLGGRPDALKRQTLAAWNALREDRTGSTWLAADAVIEAIREAVPGIADPLRALKLGIRAGLFRVKRVGRERWVAVGDHARAEQRIADSVRRLQNRLGGWPTGLPVSETEGDGLPSAHQATEWASATLLPVGCLTGGPGTGKTHTLSFGLRALIEAHGGECVAVCAPTGKAAVRATESLAARGVSVRATTIHALLKVGKAGGDGGWGFEHGRDSPLPFRFVVVDEASMIDANLMADLLDACGDGTHVLFVGDPHQLAPVGHGCPLRDMLAAEAPHGELTEVRRNSGAIVRACAAIKGGTRPVLTARFDLDAADPANLRFLECGEAEVLDQIETVLTGMTRFDPVWDCQILTPVNEKSPTSRKAINERLHRVLNPDGVAASGVPFRSGDKVICTKNGKMRPAQPDGNYRDEAALLDANRWLIEAKGTSYVANGEIGKVSAVNTAGMVVTANGKVVWVPKSKAKADDSEDGDGGATPGGGMGDWELAYAVTGHKSQGSEWPVVIVVADRAGGGVADRNWWYTALSRGSKAVIVAGDRASFDTQSRRATLCQRKTFLAELLRGELDETSTKAGK